MQTPVTPDFNACQTLDADELKRLQATLGRRLSTIDRENIWGVGFGPKVISGCVQNHLVARVLVHTKRARVARSRRIPAQFELRLRASNGNTYRRLCVRTDVVAACRPRSSGIHVRMDQRRATAAIIVRWSNVTQPNRDHGHPSNHDWNWGFLTVGHLIGSRSAPPRGTIVHFERLSVCRGQATEIAGSIVAWSRPPQGPDAMLLETGRDRIWLSNLVSDPNALPLSQHPQDDQLRWLKSLSEGYLDYDGGVGRWQFSMYLPRQYIAGLGTATDLLRFESIGAESSYKQLEPGTSGALLLDGGAPLAMQIAAEPPAYRVGYAQLLSPTLKTLKSNLKAKHLELLRVG